MPISPRLIVIGGAVGVLAVLVVCWGIEALCHSLRSPAEGARSVSSTNLVPALAQRGINPNSHPVTVTMAGGALPWDASATAPRQMTLASLPGSWSNPAQATPGTANIISPGALPWSARTDTRNLISLATLPWSHDHRVPECVFIATATLLDWNLAPDSSCPPSDFPYYAKPADAAVKALLPPAPLAALAALPADDFALRAAIELLVASIRSGQNPAPQLLNAVADAIEHSSLAAADLYPLSCSLAFITDNDFVHTFRPLLIKAQAEFASGGDAWPGAQRTVGFARQISMLYGNNLFHDQSDWTTLEVLYGIQKDHLRAGSKERSRAWFLCAEAFYMEGWTDPAAAKHAGAMYVEMINSPFYAAFDEKDKAKADWAAGVAYFAAADYSPAAIYLKKAFECPASQYFTRDAMRCYFKSLIYLNRVEEARACYEQYLKIYHPGFSQGIEMATAIEDAEIRRSEPLK
jgi:hypothetical protein